MGVFKSMFGGAKAPQQVEVAPAPQVVSGNDTAADLEAANNKKKKRSGFTSTQSGSLLEGSASDGGARQTLG